MKAMSGVLATLVLAATVPATAADRRFGITGGVSTFGGWGWRYDYGSYTDGERTTLLSAGVGVRGRSGKVHRFAHALLGTYQETYTTDTSSIGGEESESSHSVGMAILGGGFDVEAGLVRLRLSLEFLYTAAECSGCGSGRALRLNLGVGY